jgi:BirA family transcriptional regulator, biotin operon repressor / biotin---[acetyl-CoA-carboxylase] ligase
MARARKPAPSRARAAPLVAQVFARLADGEFHSGEELAQALEVSRSAVWKASGALRELGATLQAVRNRGYRLGHATEALEAASIRAHLTREVREHVSSVDSLWSTDSTNSVLLKRPNPPHGKSEVVTAEYQTAGRGRRGRAWLAPPGGAICLSLNWTFREVPQDLSALGLVIGVCLLRALRRLGVSDAALKWPNDILVAERKLSGVLIELRAESAGPACVVIGIGLNVALGATLLKRIAETGIAATDLVSSGATGETRNEVTGALVSSCVQGLMVFEREGLKPFIEEWRGADALRGRPVAVSAPEGSTHGLARGIDVRGALMVETPQGVRRFISGDVTVRAG